MAFRLDHVFVLTDAYDAAAARLWQAGFAVEPERRHPGQGTANRCVFFDNGYLEILWVADRDEVASAVTRPTGLDQRSRWRDTAASPFGVALREEAGSSGDIPFAYVPYRPAFVPEPDAILLADEPAESGAPLVFVLPPGLPGRTQDHDHESGARVVTGILITATVASAASPALTMLKQRSLASVEVATAPHLHVELDQGRQGRSIELGPQTPLSIAW